MSSRRVLSVCGLALCGLLLNPAGRSFTQPVASDRIVQPIDNSSVSLIKGNVSPWAQSRYDQGPVDESFGLNHITLVFKPSSSQQSDLDNFLLQLQDPSSPEYHQWLSPEQYASRFGLTENDFAKVVSWLQEQGFTIEEAARGRNWVAFSGTAGQVEQAFHTTIHRYVVRGESRYSNSAEPSVPSALAGVVMGIRGLDDYRPKPKVRAGRLRGVRPNYTSSVSGSHYVVPGDLATIYNIQGLYNAGITGAGEKIAVMGQTDIVMKDITQFRSLVGLPANNPTVVTIPSYVSQTTSGDLTEADLDLEWSGGVASNADIIYVNAGGSTNGAFDSLTYAIDNNVAPIISMTYGGCEGPDIDASAASSVQTMLQQATTEGITIVAAAGDDGATDCDNNDPSAPTDIAVNGLAVDFTASSPNVTAIGGSEFSGDSATGANTYWSGTNNATTQASALSYIPEVVWNDTATDMELSATGGGASIFFTKPKWQTGVGVPNDGARDVPDVSLTASPDEDPYLICSSDYVNTDTSATADCSNGFRATDGTLDVVGGTSAATPSFAGILALLEQKMASRQGNINQVLYPLFAKSASAFHNITNGNNEQPCEAGTPDCPNGGQIGFTAGTGYSQTTGLGSVNAYNLVMDWSSVAPITGSTADFAISPSPQNLSISTGNSSTSTLTVFPNNGFAGTVSVACSVASTLSGVTCSISPATVAGSGTATLTVSASSSARFFGSGRFKISWPFEEAWILACVVLLGAAGLWARNRKSLVFMQPRALGRIGLGLALAGLLAAPISCGGGSSSSTTTMTTTPTTESGDVTVTATSGSLSHTTQVYVAVN